MTALAYEYNRTILYLYHGVIEGTKLIRFEFDQITNGIAVPSNLHASTERLVMPTITFFFGIGEELCKVAFLEGQILMIGLDDGSVHLLYIDHYEDVRTLENKIRNAKKIQVDNVPIVDITVLEVDKKPCIVAITQLNVH